MPPQPSDPWLEGFDAGIDQAIRLVDSLRGPGTSTFSSPIFLRLRAELIALRTGHQERPAA